MKITVRVFYKNGVVKDYRFKDFEQWYEFKRLNRDCIVKSYYIRLAD